MLAATPTHVNAPGKVAVVADGILSALKAQDTQLEAQRRDLVKEAAAAGACRRRVNELRDGLNAVAQAVGSRARL